MNPKWGQADGSGLRTRPFVLAVFLALAITTAGSLQCTTAPTPPGDDNDCVGPTCGSNVDPPDGDDPDDGDPNTPTPLDDCAGAVSISGENEFAFSNANATQDGPAHAACAHENFDQIDKDIWMCWTSPCTSLVVVDTCGRTQVDTRIAVYDGCECPVSTARLLDCSDDNCSVQSRATFEAVSGRSYLIRLGSFPNTPGGAGDVSVRCGFSQCPSAGDCNTAHGGQGCSDALCCNSVCEIDVVCCTIEWDDVCAQEADALCNGGFDSCAASSGSCTTGRTTPGCNDVECCNAVCLADPYCCLNEWDSECVTIEGRTCFTACQSSAVQCDTSHDGPGCDDAACCAEVCPRDPSCCTTAWTDACAQLADEFCP